MSQTYTITVSDTEHKSLEYAAVSPLEWADNAVSNRARIAKDEIISLLIAHCNANNIALAVGEDAQVTQAYDLGVVVRLADVPAPTPPSTPE